MYELNWTSVDFSDNFILNKKNELSSEHDCVIKEAMVTIGTALLILAGMLIVAITAVQLYATYSSEKLVKEALEMARRDNRQIDLYTTNRYNICVNLSNKDSLSIAGEQAGVRNVTIYPKDYRTQRVVLPNGTTITPYSLPLGK